MAEQGSMAATDGSVPVKPAVGKRRRRHPALRSPYGKPGGSPGTPGAQEQAPSPRVSLFDFSASKLTEHSPATLDQCRACAGSPNVTWIHVQGTPDAATLQFLVEVYHLHSLLVEDIVNVGQRPKLEAYDDQLFLVLNLPREVAEEVHPVQVSLVLGPSYVLSFCAGEADPFEPIRGRIRVEPPGRIRQRGVDYLLYALVDLVVDEAFPVLDALSHGLEGLEERVLSQPEPASLDAIHRAKRNLLLLRKMLWPHREIVGSLVRGEHGLVTEATRVYLRDCSDHMAHLLDLVETYREIATSLQELYLSGISNRMNDIMKVLTIIATIFIPLTFLTGLYGMNFNTAASPWNMPELNTYFGYPAFLLAALAIAIGLIVYFRRRGWF